MADALLKWELTSLSEAVYALLRGTASYEHPTSVGSRKTKDRVVSGPDRPAVYELLLPVFRFICYPGGRATISKREVEAAQDRIEAEGLKQNWQDYLNSKSSIVYATKASGYLERNQPKEVIRCAEILLETIGVTRNPITHSHAPTKPRLDGRVTIFSVELSETHVAALERAAQDQATIKFRGRPHTVRRLQGGWNVLKGGFDTNYELERM